MSKRDRDEASDREGLSLVFYESYNTTHHDPKRSTSKTFSEKKGVSEEGNTCTGRHRHRIGTVLVVIDSVRR